MLVRSLSERASSEQGKLLRRAQRAGRAGLPRLSGVPASPRMAVGAAAGEVLMSDVVYVSHVRIERQAGPLRQAYLPAERLPVTFGVHGAVAAHYKVDPNVVEPHATTLDYVVAATGG
jgi:hypothetical protein